MSQGFDERASAIDDSLAKLESVSLARPVKWLALFTIMLLQGCNVAEECSSQVLDKTFDPHNDRYATTEVRSCGATTDYATVVRVGRSGEDHHKAQEVFVADSNHGKALTSNGAGDSIWIRVGWTDIDKLSITYAEHARVFKRLPRLDAATITYREGAPYQPILPAVLNTGAAL